LLDKVGETGPYAPKAAALRAQINRSDVIKLAQKTYDNGLGDRAVDMLTKVGLGDSQTVARMRAVIAAKIQARDALQAGDFAKAQAAWEEILRLEPVQANAYAQEAKRNLDSLPAKKKEYAQKLVDQADLARKQADDEQKDLDLQNHEYQTALHDYEEALKLDPANKEAKAGLALTSKSAVIDFNIAIALPCDTLEQVNNVLQILQSVCARILVDDKIYREVSGKITEVQRLKAKLEKQGGPKGP
jgi:tetratricopeptide (TPR) repeat protein